MDIEKERKETWHENLIELWRKPLHFVNYLGSLKSSFVVCLSVCLSFICLLICGGGGVSWLLSPCVFHLSHKLLLVLVPEFMWCFGSLVYYVCWVALCWHLQMWSGPYSYLWTERASPYKLSGMACSALAPWISHRGTPAVWVSRYATLVPRSVGLYI